MTLGRAKAIISYIWLILGSIIYALVVYLTLIGKFRFSASDWDAGLSWVTPLVLPVLGFIIPTWTIVGTNKDHVILKNIHVFIAAVLMSVLYLLALFGVLWLLPQEIGAIEKYVNEVMRTSSWFLGTFQALIVVVLGKFFLEEIREEIESEFEGNANKGRRKARKGNQA
jgi:hypothetical protein